MLEIALRTALVDWLRSAPELVGTLNAVEEEAPLRTAPPWLGIVASAAIDWSVKDRRGQEIRLAFELHSRGDDAVADGATVRSIDRRIEAFPRLQPDFEIASLAFLRGRAERRAANLRAVLLEYRFRVLESA